ncbi:MAG: cellulase family glycosylhydrolase [Candidatus Omnitrophota bacterium]
MGHKYRWEAGMLRGIKSSAVLLTLIAILGAQPLQAEPLKIGTTFSQKECVKLGLNWEVAYRIILSENFDIVRICAYWDEIEKKENQYNYKDLNFKVKEAAARGTPVVLTIGMKGPRWPEYFIPEWLKEKIKLPSGSDVSKNALLRERALKFVRKTVTHYRNNKDIHFWEIENEPLNKAGDKDWFIGENFLKNEVNVVKESDEEKRPIIITTAVYPNKILRFIDRLLTRRDPIEKCIEIGDIVGLNIYSAERYRLFGINMYFPSDKKTRKEYFSSLAGKIKKAGKEVWVTELQAEPWDAEYSETQKGKTIPSGSPEKTKEMINELREAGINTFLLMGAEYWLYKRMKFGDMKWIDFVKDTLNQKDGE